MSDLTRRKKELLNAYNNLCSCYGDIISELTKNNQQLKEILYKCRKKLDELDYGCEVWAGELTGFIEEIDQVIGEKK